MDCREECGVFGIWAPDEPVLGMCYTGIFSLQHRGQEGAGIACCDGKSICVKTGLGLVSEVYKDADLGDDGRCAIGHVQYSSRKEARACDLLPLTAQLPQGKIAISYNGRLTNYAALRACLEDGGMEFHTDSDAEVILCLLSRSSCPDFADMLRETVQKLEGGFSILLMTDSRLIAIRDSCSHKPLCLGALKPGQFAVASESCAIDAIDGRFVRDLAPGEILMIDASGMRSLSLGAAKQQRRCAFEYIYFARADSVMDNINIWTARYEMGRQLAREYLPEADIVVAVPSSGTTAAMGYSRESGIPLAEGILKNAYAGRTFILPRQEEREAAVRMKLAPIKKNLKGKKIVLVDDSMVRGTTMRYVAAMLRQCEVKQIYLCLSSP